MYDSAFMENCVLVKSPKPDGGWLLAYSTSPPTVTRNTKNWEGNGALQYIGLAHTQDPSIGPWERLNRTILVPKPDGFEENIAINPAVLWFPNGTVVVSYRGAKDDGFGNCVMHDWRSPCIRPVVNTFSDPIWAANHVEDSFTYKGPRGYIMLAHEFHPAGRGVKAHSTDGLHWTWGGDAAYPYTMPLVNGTVLSFYRREEPKLLFDAVGRPTALFNVVDPNFLYNETRIIVQELDYS
jgi:hypothetical protein